MSIHRRLLRVESMAESLGVYVPAVMVQRLVNLLRMVLFVWLMGKVQFGLLGLATMVFTLASTVVTLGGFSGIIRYVSYYQARGQLRAFYRASMWQLAGVAGLLTLAGLAGSPWLTDLAIGTTSGASSIGTAEREAVFRAAMINGLLAGLYLNLTAWLRGLRAYRILAGIDVLYALLFLGLGLGVLHFSPTALGTLAAHAVSLALALGLGVWALHWLVRQTEQQRPNDAPPTALDGGNILRRLLIFSGVSLAGGLIWQAQSYTSLWFIQRFHGEQGAGTYQAYFGLCQAIPVLAMTVWAVVLSHVSMHWEADSRDLARSQLEVSYKAMTLALTALAVLLALTVDLWVAVLPEDFRAARPLLPWLLMYFLSSANLGYVYIASTLHERPSVSALTGLVAWLTNIALAAWLVPAGAHAGPYAGAMAAGLAGGVCLLVSAGYLLLSRFGASPSAIGLSFSPALLLLPPLWATLLLTGLLALTFATPAILSTDQKRLLLSSAGKILARLPWPRRA